MVKLKGKFFPGSLNVPPRELPTPLDFQSITPTSIRLKIILAFPSGDQRPMWRRAFNIHHRFSVSDIPSPASC